jgi:hypothetical protein
MALAWAFVMPGRVQSTAIGSIALFGPPLVFMVAASLFFGKSFFQ